MVVFARVSFCVERERIGLFPILDDFGPENAS